MCGQVTGQKIFDEEKTVEIVEEMPLLEAELRNWPSNLYYGEVCDVDLVLRNVGIEKKI